MTTAQRPTPDVTSRPDRDQSTSSSPSHQSASSSTTTPTSSTITTTTLPFRPARPGSPRRSTIPEYPRSSTSPSTAGTVELPAIHSVVHPRPRNRSPYSRSHLRSGSANMPAVAQPMARAHSLPARTSSPASFSPQIGAASPLLRSPAHSGSPFRPSSPGEYYTANSPSFYDGGFETISEHAELDLTQSSHDRNMSSLNSSRPFNGRPRSQPRQSSPSRSPLTSSASSPSLLNSQQKFNETYPPPLHHYGSTSSFSTTLSMPSTPSTTRSRSPSISSLDTIEDAPDLEWEAIEADRVAKLKEEAEAEERGETYTRRGGSLDIPQRPSTGFGFSRVTGAGGARKRWSVCGGERRADLDLETIWED